MTIKDNRENSNLDHFQEIWIVAYKKALKFMSHVPAFAFWLSKEIELRVCHYGNTGEILLYEIVSN